MSKGLDIVFGYRGINEFIHNVELANSPDYSELWMKYVIDPYWEKWGEGQFNGQRIKAEIKEPLKDLGNLRECIQLLEQSDIQKIIINTYDKITDLLPSPEPHRAICIYINNTYDQSTHGVVGTCVGDNILVRINPMIPGWEQYLPWVIAHEYNHCIWGYNHYYLKGNRSQNLLTSIIAEGQADGFGKFLCPDLSPMWTRALSEEEETKQWNMLKEYLDHEDSMELHCRFFFGDSKTNTPPFVGYTIGFNIVQQYLKNNPQTSFTQLVEKDAREILAGSGYNPQLEPSLG